MTVLTRKRMTFAALASVLCIAAAGVEGRVVSITIDSTTTVAGGPFGDIGNYQLVRGRAFGELDMRASDLLPQQGMPRVVPPPDWDGGDD